jgi:hypothetical protein
MRKIVILILAYGFSSLLFAEGLIEAEDVVQFKPDSSLIACESKEQLKELIKHMAYHETTLAKEMFQNAQCIRMTPGIKWKVLETSYSFANHFIYIKNDDNPEIDIRLWTYEDSVEVVH